MLSGEGEMTKPGAYMGGLVLAGLREPGVKSEARNPKSETNPKHEEESSKRKRCCSVSTHRHCHSELSEESRDGENARIEDVSSGPRSFAALRMTWRG